MNRSWTPVGSAAGGVAVALDGTVLTAVQPSLLAPAALAALALPATRALPDRSGAEPPARTPHEPAPPPGPAPR
ncbi:hypothetical protein [Streptomyces sp. NRRL S-1022]|uniref:hypothetical protein n=1 Tax=Streptomyces sp. NRRL S-1022 TaxID=1463880 RepID=UPI0004C0B609|nr:hypothetical protein [Streptomyces sp. NRRL S-1022]